MSDDEGQESKLGKTGLAAATPARSAEERAAQMYQKVLEMEVRMKKQNEIMLLLHAENKQLKQQQERHIFSSLPPLEPTTTTTTTTTASSTLQNDIDLSLLSVQLSDSGCHTHTRAHIAPGSTVKVKNEHIPVSHLIDLENEYGIVDRHTKRRQEAKGGTVREYAVRKDKLTLPGKDLVLKRKDVMSFIDFKSEFENYASTVGLLPLLKRKFIDLLNETLELDGGAKSIAHYKLILNENAGKLYSALKQCVGSHYQLLHQEIVERHTLGKQLTPSQITTLSTRLEGDVYVLWTHLVTVYSAQSITGKGALSNWIQQFEYTPTWDPDLMKEKLTKYNSLLAACNPGERPQDFTQEQLGRFVLQAMKRNMPAVVDQILTSCSMSTPPRQPTLDDVCHTLKVKWENLPYKSRYPDSIGISRSKNADGAANAATGESDGSAHAAVGGKAGPCFNFQNTGSCKFGTRCRFSHSKQSHNPNSRKQHDNTSSTHTGAGGFPPDGEPASANLTVALPIVLPANFPCSDDESDSQSDTDEEGGKPTGGSLQQELNLMAATMISSLSSPNIFLLDSGASYSSFIHKGNLTNVKSVDAFTITGYDGSTMVVRETGSLQIANNLVLNNVVYMPKSRVNLVSLNHLHRSGFHTQEKWIGKQMHSIEVYLEKEREVKQGNKKVKKVVRQIYLIFVRDPALGLYIYKRDGVPPAAPEKPALQINRQPPAAAAQLGHPDSDGKESASAEARKELQAAREKRKTQTKAQRPQTKTAYISPRKRIIPLKPRSTGQTTTRQAHSRFYFSGSCIGLANAVFQQSSSLVNSAIFTAANPKQHKTSRLGHAASTSEIDHSRLGHVGRNVNDCVSCLVGKSKRLAIGEYSSPEYFKTTSVMDLWTWDFVGPATVKVKISNVKGVVTVRAPSLGKNLYTGNGCDVHTRYKFSFLSASKTAAEVCDKIVNCVSAAQVKHNKKLKRFHADGGKEFINSTLGEWLKKNGTEVTCTNTDTPEHNGIIERFNGTQAAVARTMMHEAGAPYILWGEAVLAATYLDNRNHDVTVNGKTCTQYEHWTGDKPKLDQLRVWGSDCFVWIPKENRGKMQETSWPGIFVGYSEQQSGYRVLNPATGRVVTSRNVAFRKNEKTFEHCKLLVGSTNNKLKYQEGDFIHIPGSGIDNYENDSNPEVASNESEMSNRDIPNENNNRDIPNMNETQSQPIAVINPTAVLTMEKQNEKHNVDAKEINVEHLRLTESDADVDLGSESDEEHENKQHSLPDGDIDSNFEIRASNVSESSGVATLPSLRLSGIPFAGIESASNPIETLHGIPMDLERHTEPAVTTSTAPVAPASSLRRSTRTRRQANHGQVLTSDVFIPTESEILQSTLNLSEAEAHVNPNVGVINVSISACVAFDDVVDQGGVVFSVCANPHPKEPTTHSQAMDLPEKLLWVEAESAEFKSLVDLGVFKIVDRQAVPKGTTIVPSKIVYKVKYGSNGLPARFKCRVVAKGFKQVFNVNYDLTFAPVVRGQSIKMILSIVNQFDMEHQNFDVKTAFLYGDLPDRHPVYMTPPEGWTGDPTAIWQLIKTLYGLKQSPREWNAKFDGSLTKLGWKPILSDRCVYIKKSLSGKLMLMYLYVDDTGVVFHKTDRAEWESDLKKLKLEYEIDAVGDSGWILNMKVTRDREKRELCLSQEVYVEQMLEHFGLANCTPVSNPCVAGSLDDLLGKNQQPKLCDEHNKKLFQSMVGGLLYAANTTRMDICAAVGMLTPHCAKPFMHHITAAKHVFHYLAGTRTRSMIFKHSSDNESTITNGKETISLHDHMLYAYADSNWGGSKGDHQVTKRKSTTGVLVKLFGNTVSWMSKRQSTVAKSSAEAEYQALSMCLSEILWHHKWLKEVLGYERKTTLFSSVDLLKEELLFLSDSQSAVALCHNEGAHQRTRHIDISHHFISDWVQKGAVKLMWVPTAKQQADLLTKGVTDQTFKHLTNLLMSK